MVTRRRSSDGPLGCTTKTDQGGYRYILSVSLYYSVEAYLGEFMLCFLGEIDVEEMTEIFSLMYTVQVSDLSKEKFLF